MGWIKKGKLCFVRGLLITVEMIGLCNVALQKERRKGEMKQSLCLRRDHNTSEIQGVITQAVHRTPLVCNKTYPKEMECQQSVSHAHGTYTHPSPPLPLPPSQHLPQQYPSDERIKRSRISTPHLGAVEWDITFREDTRSAVAAVRRAGCARGPGGWLAAPSILLPAAAWYFWEKYWHVGLAAGLVSLVNCLVSVRH